METKALWIGVLGIAFGVGATVATRGAWAHALAHAHATESCTAAGCKTRPPALAKSCPAHFADGKIAVTSVAEIENVRISLMQGVFEPWFELGRAPTPDEIGARLKLDRPATEALMDTFAACGSSMGFGVHRVPESELIAVAWPLSNVPTGIEVTLEGKKPVHARCAFDALGVSRMMGRRASIDATTHDGVPLHVEVDGDQITSATPADAVVFKGSSCDEMLFFSSPAALAEWKKQHHADGPSFELRDAARRAAESFGMYSQPFRG